MSVHSSWLGIGRIWDRENLLLSEAFHVDASYKATALVDEQQMPSLSCLLVCAFELRLDVSEHWWPGPAGLDIPFAYPFF